MLPHPEQPWSDLILALRSDSDSSAHHRGLTLYTWKGPITESAANVSAAIKLTLGQLGRVLVNRQPDAVTGAVRMLRSRYHH